VRQRLARVEEFRKEATMRQMSGISTSEYARRVFLCLREKILLTRRMSVVVDG
jgi:hypothetical protein